MPDITDDDRRTGDDIRELREAFARGDYDMPEVLS